MADKVIDSLVNGIVELDRSLLPVSLDKFDRVLKKLPHGCFTPRIVIEAWAWYMGQYENSCAINSN